LQYHVAEGYALVFVKFGGVVQAYRTGFVLLFGVGFLMHWHGEWFPWLEESAEKFGHLHEDLLPGGVDERLVPRSPSPTPPVFPLPTPWLLHPSPTPTPIFTLPRPSPTAEPKPDTVDKWHLFYEILEEYVTGGEHGFHVKHVLLFIVGASIGYNWGAMAGDFVRLQTRTVIPADEAATHVKEWVTVEGDVTKVVSKEGNTYLHIGTYHPNPTFTILPTLVAWIPAASPASKSHSLSGLQGSSVKVTGRIELYRDKPIIRIDSALQLEVE
jgi:hypothetical protein